MKLEKWEERLVRVMDYFGPLSMLYLSATSSKVEVVVLVEEERNFKDRINLRRTIDGKGNYGEKDFTSLAMRPPLSDYSEELLEGNYRKMFDCQVVHELIKKKALNFLGCSTCQFYSYEQRENTEKHEEFILIFTLNENLGKDLHKERKN